MNMKAQSLDDLLRKGDRVAVSNITGREASNVSYVSQAYCGNIVAGWSLGKAGQTIAVPAGRDIPVFGQFDELIDRLGEDQKPGDRESLCRQFRRRRQSRSDRQGLPHCSPPYRLGMALRFDVTVRDRSY